MRFGIVILLVTVTSAQNQSPVRHRRLFIPPVDRYLRVNGRPEQQQQVFGGFENVGFSGPQSNPNFQDFRELIVDGNAGNFRQNFNQRQNVPNQQTAGWGQGFNTNEPASRRNFNSNNGEQYYESDEGKVFGINQQDSRKSVTKYIEISQIAEIQAQIRRDNKNRNADTNSDSQNNNRQFYSNADSQKSFGRRQDSERTTLRYFNIAQNKGSNLQYENRDTNPAQGIPNYNIQGLQGQHRTKNIQPSYNVPTSTEDFLFRSGDSISQHQYNSNGENRRENDHKNKETVRPQNNRNKNNEGSAESVHRGNNDRHIPSNTDTHRQQNHHASNIPNFNGEVKTPTSPTIQQTGTSYGPDISNINTYTNENFNDQGRHSTNSQRNKQTTVSGQRKHSVDINTHTTSKTVIESRPTEENDIKPKEDRWVWGEVEDKITTEKDSTSDETTLPDLEDRVNFTGDKCPTGKVKIKGRCVFPD